ncbi:precorrin-2 C(20)-methyltransferase [Spirulina sp. 06S082]|uniref:precorrin-2 C(20)-methyltransferase n=1 Tax=Spirulina sp. 06S082 TaxID=3110248 RepID=UPI002B1F43AB|nr:precorrin-2 C(20)-methyltransferase [Spirulina sp. 06S082]MEA5471320.1 precorrin-2 C(20)-methyltransferase [Spirulina sp. 06S082]
MGTLYGISIGTGDPELITLKGLRLLREADAIAFPAGIDGKPGVAQQIIEPWLAYQQPTLPLEFPYVSDRHILTQAWQKAADLVWQYLQKGENVAFACEGDISFYSTFTHLAQTLQEHHPEVKIEIVPGVTSPCAAAAMLGIPLTVQGQRMAILPALYTVDELESVLAWADVAVLLKVASVYEKVWQILEKRNLLEGSWIVERATCPDQKIYHLRDRPTLKLSYFSILIIQIHRQTWENSLEFPAAR